MTMTPFNFVAHLTATPGTESALQKALEECVGPSRAEPGNINYDLHRSPDDSTVFVIYEGWASQDALATHFDTPHFKKLIEATDPLVFQRGPDGQPFTAESLTMLTETATR